MTINTTPRYYRSLAELENSSEFREFVEREFPQAASEAPTGLSRRRWLQLMGASLVLSGVAGCRYEKETIAAFGSRAPNRTPGEAKYFNTSIEIGGHATALRVTNYDGRPTKVDGNPEAPGGGGCSSFAQASCLELYDPDRGRSPHEAIGDDVYSRSWTEAYRTLDEWSEDWVRDEGKGLCVLAEPTSSPTVTRLRRDLQNRYPGMRWFHYAPTSRYNARHGARMAFGRDVEVQLDIAKAKVIVAVDCDLLQHEPNATVNAARFASGRDPNGEMSRLYAVECEVSTTGVAADHRLALRSSQIASFLVELESAIEHEVRQPDPKASLEERYLTALADDLRRHPGRSLIAVGPQQPAAVHALAHRLNERLENLGSTVHCWSAADESTAEDGPEQLAELARILQENSCQHLLILGGNPVFDTPFDVKFSEALLRAPHRCHVALHPNETSSLCNWYLPLSHPLESWSDCRLPDGAYGVGQPQIAPLFESRNFVELLSYLAGRKEDALTTIRRTAERIDSRLSAPKAWAKVVHDGLHRVEDRSREHVADVQDFDLPSHGSSWRSERGGGASDVAAVRDQLELVFSSYGGVGDGRYANNSWLQELPHPLTKVTWGNAAVMSPVTAKALGLKHEDVVRLEKDGRNVELPVYILPGQATGSIAVALGYGRTHAGLIGGSTAAGVAPVGVDVSPLRTADDFYRVDGVQATPTGRRRQLASTQDHFAIDETGLQAINDRLGDLVREGTLSDFQQHPDFAKHTVHHPPLESLWTEPSYDGHAWGMSIDLNKCIGCNACVTACQSENNVPVVGPEQVIANREMHWIRVDRYFKGDPEQPEFVTQPVTCHHCENAPCEQVCPVAATVHSDEGLNDMVYNRCIGTRYCGNNCPYKVRRFNFLDYRNEQPASNRDLSDLILNPEVTVRSRGVMEKCTYCVQRIQNAKIDARNDQRPLGPNEVVTACQQACPSQAIEFGDLNNPQSKVAQAHADPRAYGMLAELNVKPRTKYLSRIRNLHPWMVNGDEAGQGGRDEHHEHHEHLGHEPKTPRTTPS